MKTPISQLIQIIENIGCKNEVSDETKDALSQLADHIIGEARLLLTLEKEVITKTYDKAADDSREGLDLEFVGEDYYNETFEPLPVEPVVLNQAEFDEYMKQTEEKTEA